MYWLLPTGGGKSICFQVPGMLHHGTVGDLSLIALMTDQVNQLKTEELKQRPFMQGLPWKTAERILDNTASGAVKFLYVSPERLVSERFRDRLPYLQIKLLVVDEALHLNGDMTSDLLTCALKQENCYRVCRSWHHSHCNGSCGTRHEKLLQMRQPYVYRSTFCVRICTLLSAKKRTNFKSSLRSWMQ